MSNELLHGARSAEWIASAIHSANLFDYEPYG
jgi:hypothetical protein